MKRTIHRAALALAVLAAALAPVRAASAEPAPTAATPDSVIFAGGCFWGIQAVFQHTRGVLSATAGYSGGTVDRPTYEQVSTGRTGHAESVKVVYDPSKVSYNQLMEIFFASHDPTTLNHQGPDDGTQYRTAIFYTTPAQQRETQAFIAKLNAAHVFGRPIVTQVSAAKSFWRAESYHQSYAEMNPDAPYIVINDAPKVVNLQRQFPSLYTSKLAAHE